MRYLAGVAAVLFFFVATSAFPADEEQPYRATVDSDGVQRVVVVGGSYFFKPSKIVVKVNVPVELTVSKESGIVPHTVVADSPDAGIVFSESLSTDPKVIKFTPTRAGIYPFYCDKKLLFFASHREKGMKGTIEVVE